MKRSFLLVLAALSFLLCNAEDYELTPKIAKKLATISLGNDHTLVMLPDGRIYSASMRITNYGKNYDIMRPYDHITIEAPIGADKRYFDIKTKDSYYTVYGTVLRIYPAGENATIIFSYQNGKILMQVENFNDGIIYSYDVETISCFKKGKSYSSTFPEVIFEDIKAYFSSKLKQK